MSAIVLLEALDRFLEVADATKFNRRRRQALIPIERELERSLAVAFKRQSTLLAKLLAKEKSRFVETIEDFDWWEAYLTAAQMRTLRLFTGPIDRAARRALLAGALHVLADTGVAMSFSLQNPRAVAWLQDYGAQRVAKIDETTRQYIKTVITEGVEHGWSYDQMARTIIERYREFAVGQPQQHIKSRAHLIAVTEVGEAYCEGNLQMGQVLQDAGFVMEKKWMTVGDDRVSAVCRGNEAQGWIPLNQPFQSGHIRPLAHPACRCDLLTRRQPVVSEARRTPLVEFPGQPRDKQGRFARGKGSAVDFDARKRQSLGRSADLRNQYQKDEPGRDYLRSADVILQPGRIRHLQERDKARVNFLKREPTLPVEAIRSPEIVYRHLVLKESGHWSQVFARESRKYPGDWVVVAVNLGFLPHQAGPKYHEARTIHPCGKDFFYRRVKDSKGERWVLKDRWKEVKTEKAGD